MADLEHSTLTDPNLHEPKGASTATDGQIYVSDGSGSGAWTDPADITFDVGSTGSFTSDLELYKTESISDFSTGWADRSSGTTWTTGTNNIASASVSTNNISLPAGTYVVEANASFSCLSNQSTINDIDCMLRVRDTTSSSTLVVGTPIRILSTLIGSSQNQAGTFSYGGGTAVLKGRFTIGSTKTVRLQFYSGSTTAPISNTIASESGESAVTAYIRFWKIA